MEAISPTSVPANTNDHGYEALLQHVRGRLAASVGPGRPVFTTDADDLYDLFLAGLPAEEQQHYTCRACRRFVETYGSLVTIEPDGTTTPILWSLDDDTPSLFRPAIKMMQRAVQRASVTGVFYSDATVWGTPVTGVWHHLSATPPDAMVWRDRVRTAEQAMAVKREDYATLQRALITITRDHLTTAVTLLKAEALKSPEKTLGVAEWLLDLRTREVAVKGVSQRSSHVRRNMVWLAVATAPPGYCHPKSSMIGTLLDDIAEGYSFAEIKRRFDAKMHPLKYQRPQAPPSAGNVRQAEQLVEQLGVASALKRRYARLDDIEPIWIPTPRQRPQETPGGVFGHLMPQGQATPQQLVTPPPVTMTWEKFRREVLPTASEIAFHVTPHDNYLALVTAADPEAPLIFQWDNPVSAYVYHNGSGCQTWGLTAGAYHPVTAVTLQPTQWGGRELEHQAKGVIFILDGAKDHNWQHAGLSLFPSTLRSEFHPIRATVEAFSKAGTIEGFEEASACGISLNRGGSWKARFRVTSANGTVLEYILDRWD